MVMAAISVLSILVTEFAYIAQVNQRMAYDSMDQVKAHYLAKAGVKLSLLRLKAYAQLKPDDRREQPDGASSSNPLAGAIPKSVLDKVWNFPFMYPLPALPGHDASPRRTRSTNSPKARLSKENTPPSSNRNPRSTIST